MRSEEEDSLFFFCCLFHEAPQTHAEHYVTEKKHRVYQHNFVQLNSFYVAANQQEGGKTLIIPPLSYMERMRP